MTAGWQPGVIVRKDRDNVWRQKFAHSLADYQYPEHAEGYETQRDCWKREAQEAEERARVDAARTKQLVAENEAHWRRLAVESEERQKRQREENEEEERRKREAVLLTNMQKVYDLFGTTTVVYRSNLGERAADIHADGKVTYESLKECEPWTLRGWLQTDNTIASIDGMFLKVETGDMVRSLDSEQLRVVLRTEPREENQDATVR